jgi:hypothetical protein
MKINSEVLQKAEENSKFFMITTWEMIGTYVMFLDTETRQQMTDQQKNRLRFSGLIVPNYETDEDEAAFPLFEGEELDKDFDAFVEEYRKLFSKNSLPQWAYRSGVMGDKKMVAKKLKAFVKSDRVSQQQVLDATKYYIQNIQQGHIKYVHDADNFISKNGRSALRAMVEEFKDNPNLTDDITTVI